MLEVPLNSPRPFDSIAELARRWGDSCLVGAGTVIDEADAARVRDAGGRLVVMPHADTAVIGAAKAHGLVCLPGVATPTEAFAALRAGADGLKLFPAEALPPGVLKAWRAVLPQVDAALPRRRHRSGQSCGLLGRGGERLRDRIGTLPARVQCRRGGCGRERARRRVPRAARTQRGHAAMTAAQQPRQRITAQQGLRDIVTRARCHRTRRH